MPNTKHLLKLTKKNYRENCTSTLWTWVHRHHIQKCQAENLGQALCWL